MSFSAGFWRSVSLTFDLQNSDNLHIGYCCSGEEEEENLFRQTNTT